MATLQAALQRLRADPLACSLINPSVYLQLDRNYSQLLWAGKEKEAKAELRGIVMALTKGQTGRPAGFSPDQLRRIKELHEQRPRPTYRQIAKKLGLTGDHASSERVRLAMQYRRPPR
jgi:hypothetical protein